MTSGGERRQSIKTQWAFMLWGVLFLLMLVFSFWGHLLPLAALKHMRFWHYWEVAALGSTVIFNVLFYVLGFFLPPKMFLHVKPMELIGVIVFCMLVAILSLVGATAISILEGKCSYQLGCIVLVTVSFAAIDYTMGTGSTRDEVRNDFSQTLFLSDLPAFVAFSILFGYSLVYKVDDPGTAANQAYDSLFRAFVGGAIAFQMIASNWVLAAIFRKPGQWYQDAIDRSPR